jgi:uncharacterized protein YjbI with pentapeptide repeats
MTRDETVALFLQGKDSWNAWAERALAEREAIVAGGFWVAETTAAGYLTPKNAKTRGWMEAAQADFSRCVFGPQSSPQNREIAGDDQGRDGGVDPAVKSMFIDIVKIDFRGFVFPGDANFSGATFTSRADFANAAFGAVRFRSATFNGTADFLGATFSGRADFGGAAFIAARFRSASFAAAADFRGTTFAGIADFDIAAFAGDAFFGSATFEHSTTFGGVKFWRQANFTGMRAERSFNMKGVVFGEVPAFNQADFNQATDLDEVQFPLPGFWQPGKRGLIVEYRAIRRLALQGASYERQHTAFKGELRSRRWTMDKPWHAGFWVGLLYDGVADCGRSIVRPFFVWLLSLAAFSAFYLYNAGVPLNDWQGTCEGSAVQKWEKAASLSLSSSVPVFVNGHGEEARSFYACVSQAAMAAGAQQSDIPLSAAALQLLQLAVTAALIFLSLLAVKNRYKIK